MIKVKTTVKDNKKVGYARILEALAGLGHITLGVQGKEATQAHPDSELMIGQVAAIHELGLSGRHRTKRSWLSAWIDANQARMQDEARAVMVDIVAGRISRRKGLEKLGYAWVVALRENINNSGVRPPLKPSTVERKGHATPLLDTGAMRDAITYRIFLPRWKNVKGGISQASKDVEARTVPSPSAAEPSSPQPPKQGANGKRHGPKLPPKQGPKLPPKQGPRLPPKQGPRLPPKQGPKRARPSNKQFGPLEKRVQYGPRLPPKQGPRLPYGFRSGKVRRPKRAIKARAVARGRNFQAARKQSWLLKYLMRLARQTLGAPSYQNPLRIPSMRSMTSKQGDGRNHGYTGAVRTDRTGLAARRKKR